MEGRVVQINVSEGGVPKTPVGQAFVSRAGIVGDRQANRKHHGGPQRAVCLLALEVITTLQAEGHPITPGSTGENLTVAGLDWGALRIGHRLELEGGAVLELRSYTVPCRNIAPSFRDGAFQRLHQSLHPGSARMYASVLEEGWVLTGHAVRVVPVPASP